jgi:hypothetical protein
MTPIGTPTVRSSAPHSRLCNAQWAILASAIGYKLPTYRQNL